jgi:hypothetical protein
MIHVQDGGSPRPTSNFWWPACKPKFIHAIFIGSTEQKQNATRSAQAAAVQRVLKSSSLVVKMSSSWMFRQFDKRKKLLHNLASVLKKFFTKFISKAVKTSAAKHAAHATKW